MTDPFIDSTGAIKLLNQINTNQKIITCLFAIILGALIILIPYYFFVFRKHFNPPVKIDVPVREEEINKASRNKTKKEPEQEQHKNKEEEQQPDDASNPQVEVECFWVDLNDVSELNGGEIVRCKIKNEEFFAFGIVEKVEDKGIFVERVVTDIKEWETNKTNKKGVWYLNFGIEVLIQKQKNMVSA